MGIGMGENTLAIAINYQPPGCELDLTLAVVHHPGLLAFVLRSPIAEADARAETEGDPVAASAHRTQRDFLRRLLVEWAERETWAIATAPVPRDVM